MTQSALQGKKVVVVPMTASKRLFTRGQTVTEEVDVGALGKMGPMIEKMRVQFDGADFSSYFQVRFLYRWSVTGRLYSTDEQILPNQTTAGQVIGAWHTDDSKYGMDLKFFIEYSNVSGTANESGRVSSFLEVVLKS